MNTLTRTAWILAVVAAAPLSAQMTGTQPPPPVLLIQRELVKPGDERLIGALHQLLAWYGEMAPLRRTADRRSKRLPNNWVNEKIYCYLFASGY